MDWIERLNRGPRQLALGTGETTVEVLYWSHAPHLLDNLPHRHTYFEVCQVGAYGQGLFLVEGVAREIGPGDLFIARPGVVHQIVNTAQPQMELYWVSFTWSPKTDMAQGEIEALLQGFAASPVLIIPDESRQVAALWQALRAVAQPAPRPGFDAQITATESALLIAIAQNGAGPYTSPLEEPDNPTLPMTQARLAARYIQDNLNRPLSLAEIAAYVHLSPRHVSRLFTEFSGTSPAAYIERARMDRASGLLRQTDTPIKEVAAIVGYPDVQHFTRVFSRCFGCPPGAYRRAESRPAPQIRHQGDLV